MKRVQLSFFSASIAFIALTTSCEKEAQTTTNTNEPAFVAGKMYIIIAPGDTIIQEVDKDKALVKQTIIESTEVESIRTLSKKGNYLYESYYNGFDQQTELDSVLLDANGLITSFSGGQPVFNADGYLVKIKIGTDEINATYVNGNLVSETNGSSTYKYEYYTDKTDPYRIYTLIGEDDGFFGTHIYCPYSGKANKNLLKSMDFGGGEIYHLSYEFDASNRPTKIMVKEGNSTTVETVATISYK